MNDKILEFFNENKELLNKPFAQIDWYEIYKKAFEFGFRGPTSPISLAKFTEELFDLFGEEKILKGLTFLYPHFLEGSHNTPSITIPDNITGIGDRAFASSYIENINIPDSVDDLGFRTFEQTINLKEIVLPDSIKLIKGRCFYFSHLEKIKLPRNLDRIAHSAFTRTYLSYIDFPKTLTAISDYAFSHCEKLKEVDLPESLIYLGKQAFDNCSHLTNVIIREGLEEIGLSAFEYCFNLNELSLPHSIKNLGNKCFQDCGDITIYYNGTKEEWKKIYKPGAFKGTYFICECTDGKVVKKRR